MKKLTDYSFPQEVRVVAKVKDLRFRGEKEDVFEKLSDSERTTVKVWMSLMLTDFFRRLINESKLLVKRGDGFRIDPVKDWNEDYLPDSSEEMIDLKKKLKKCFEEDGLGMEFIVSNVANIHQFGEDFNPDTLILHGQRLQVVVGLGV